MKSLFGDPGLVARYLISQSNFNDWADSTKPRTRKLTGILLIFVMIACSAAIIVMSPRLLREGTLLWFGTKADGVVKSSDVIEIGKFKDGDPKYRLTIAYDFMATDGKPYSGTTMRGDVRTPPDYKPGDPMGVYFDNKDPSISVAEHNLRTDVYGLLLFLPWIALFGIAGPLFYFQRWRNWQRQRGMIGHTAHTSRS